MPLDRNIALDERETQVRDFLLGAAQYYSKTHGSETPVLRFAGGWVRDKLLGGESKDIDVAIDCMTGKEFYKYMTEYSESLQQEDPEIKILGRLAEIKKDAEKSKHLETATTKLFGLELDLVNLRTETYHEDSRNPEVEIGTAEEDARRRDATINALFYNINTEQVEDLTGRGLQDLEQKIIRTPLGPEQTFRDDPLRILRLIRFACRLDFQIEETAKHWMTDKSIQAALEKKISRERILVELQKMLQGPRPREALDIILERGLYNTIFTIPDVESTLLPTIDASKLPRVLAALGIVSKGDPSNTIIKKMLLSSKQECYWSWLLAALIPRIGQTLPEALIKKGAPRTMAARVARDGLKADNETVKVITAADTYAVTEAQLVCREFVKQYQGSDDQGKRKLNSIDRVSLGLYIRRWGEHWHSVAVAAFLKDLLDSDDVNEITNVQDRYEKWLTYIEKEGLDLVWNPKEFKPIIHGKDIVDCVTEAKGRVETGPWMQECVMVVFKYQLREQEKATAQGAKEAILEAIEAGEVKIVPREGGEKTKKKRS